MRALRANLHTNHASRKKRHFNKLLALISKRNHIIARNDSYCIGTYKKKKNKRRSKAFTRLTLWAKAALALCTPTQIGLTMRSTHSPCEPNGAVE